MHAITGSSSEDDGASLLLEQEFQKCGDIAQFGSFGATARGNWIYIQYQVRRKRVVSSTAERLLLHRLPVQLGARSARKMGGNYTCHVLLLLGPWA